MDYRDMIARRAALELQDGDVVNLGFGLPLAVAEHIPQERQVILQSENGCIHFGPAPRLGEQDSDVTNAGTQPITLRPGACVFDLATSFAIIRGGHVTATILGALEVDQEGNIANWSMPGRSPGMGGAMDLVAGARRTIALLQHTDRTGAPKVLKRCTLPLTGKGAVSMIITDKAVFEVTPRGLLLKEVVPGLTVADLRAITGAEFTVAPDLKAFQTGAQD
jgi:3-oxoacid CoA-transferase B subunit